mgnify:FL=1
MPETKALTLEELDIVFSIPPRKFATHQLKQIPYFIQRYILRRNVRKHPLQAMNEGVGMA